MRIWSASLLFILVACSPIGPPVPDGVLDREHFTEVLLEAQLIEARMNHELVISHALAIPGEAYYEKMFTENGTSKDEFQKSFSYYSERPLLMKDIYDDVIEELGRRKDMVAQ